MAFSAEAGGRVSVQLQPVQYEQSYLGPPPVGHRPSVYELHPGSCDDTLPGIRRGIRCTIDLLARCKKKRERATRRRMRIEAAKSEEEERPVYGRARGLRLGPSSGRRPWSHRHLGNGKRNTCTCCEAPGFRGTSRPARVRARGHVHVRGGWCVSVSLFIQDSACGASQTQSCREPGASAAMIAPLASCSSKFVRRTSCAGGNALWRT